MTSLYGAKLPTCEKLSVFELFGKGIARQYEEKQVEVHRKKADTQT